MQHALSLTPMSKEGSLSRMAKYKAYGKTEMLEAETKFYEAKYGELEKPKTKSK